MLLLAKQSKRVNMKYTSPLEWPLGYPRTKKPVTNFQFRQWKFDEAISDLEKELKLLKASQISINTNIPLRKDGSFYYNWREKNIPDKGVAVYFLLNGEQRVLCCDAWDNWEDNLHSIALTVAALRGLERWKVSDIKNRAFSGLNTKALPEVISAEIDLWRILGLETKQANGLVLRKAYIQKVQI